MNNQKLVMKKETLLNEGYLPQWGLFEAAREFTQNYVFALQYLKAEGNTYYDKENNIAIWEDFGKSFDLSCLLIGVGQQKKIDNAPGENSEGMKISLLIACRENKSCSIEIPGYTIIPSLETGKFGAKELMLNVYNNNRTQGTKFTFECDEETYNKAISNFGYLTANEKDRNKFSESSIINDDGETKSLYINGVKITTNLKSLYSYNLIGKHLSNRDRNAISPYDINYELWEQIISKTKDKIFIKTIIENASNNTIENYNTYGYMLKDNNTLNLWKQVIREMYGNLVCFATGGASDQRARYRKFKVIKTPCNEMQNLFVNHLEIKESSEIFPDKEPKKNLLQLKNLFPEEKNNVNSVRKLIQKHYCKDVWNLRYVIGLTDEHGNYVNGLCDPEKELIYLNRSILWDWDQLFRTLLHETVHQVSNADDCSEEFEEEWEKACLAFARGCMRKRS